MSYHIYTTKGIVLSSRPLREADRLYSILTRDLGLIRATALGVRKGASKLRGSLEPFAISQISFVRGKEFWRITSAERLENIPSVPEIARPLQLLEKLVQGEAHHQKLFDVVERYLTSDMIYHIAEQKEGFEINFVANILHELGYLKREDLNLPKKELIKAINEGLQHSHLT